MKLTSELAYELFRGYYIERWNEAIRMMPLIEMDKHGHKLIIAYCIGKYEEMQGHKVNWRFIIQDAIFELLRRIVISDIKSPIYQEIKKQKDVFRNLNIYVYNKLKDKLGDDEIRNDFHHFLTNGAERDSLDYQIIDAAHIYASYWEFQIVKKFNPFEYQSRKTESELDEKLKCYEHLSAIPKLLGNQSIKNFIDICGQLRFQIRWAQSPRVPRTSVLGHVMLVAIFTYLISIDLKCCDKRVYNNFFGAIFHDLPEAVTRDIISPVKKSSKELDKFISKIEKELAEKEIFPYLDASWVDEIKYFTHDEFKNKVKIDNRIYSDFSIDEISQQYNEEIFAPFDGEIIRFADHYSAYLEAVTSINSGIKSDDLILASESIKDDYYKNKKTLSCLPIFSLFGGEK